MGTLDTNRLRRVLSCFYLEDNDSSIENVTKFIRIDEHSRRPDGGHVDDEPCNFDCETIKITNNFNTCNSIKKHEIPVACSILEKAIEQTFNPIHTVGGIPSESIEEKQTKILYEKRRRTDHKRGKYKFFNGEQVKLLDEVFAKNRYPTSQDYEDLVNTLNCDKIRIKRYFQNKRQKKDNKKKDNKKIQTSIVVK